MNALRRALPFMLIIAAGAAGLWAPGTSHAAEATSPGTLTTETRSLPEFQAIALGGSVDLLVRQGPQQVQVTAGDKQLPHLETVVENGKGGPTLVVRWKREPRDIRWSWNLSWNGKDWSDTNKLVVTVTVPKLTAVRTAGSGDVVIERFETPALMLAVSGSGDATLNDLATAELGVSISGSGDVSGTGSASKLTLSIAGSGDVRFSDMRAEEVLVQIAGSGDAAINAQKSLKISIAGSGDVVYTGNPTLKSSVAGSGSISRR